MHVSSDASAGTQAVWITYTDPSHPGTWQSIDLSPKRLRPDLCGRRHARACRPALVFMVQAANGAGLVTLSTNSGLSTPSAARAARSLAHDLDGAVSAVHRRVQNQTRRSRTSHDGPQCTLSRQAVTLQIGSQQAIGTTDANGNATISMTLTQSPGSYTAVATYGGGTVSGTAYLPSSSALSAFGITPQATTLSLSPSGTTTNPASITATLQDGNGNPVVQRTVVFTETDGQGNQYHQFAITGFQGQASLGSPSLPPGIYSVIAGYGGADGPITITSAGSTITESDPDYLSSADARSPWPSGLRTPSRSGRCRTAPITTRRSRSAPPAPPAVP